MVVLGLLLLLAAGTVVTAAVVGNTDGAELTLFEQTYTRFSLGEVVLLAALSGLVLGLGLALMLVGGSRRRRHHAEAVGEERTRAQQLEQQNERLRSELDERPAYPTEDANPSTPRHADEGTRP